MNKRIVITIVVLSMCIFTSSVLIAQEWAQEDYWEKQSAGILQRHILEKRVYVNARSDAGLTPLMYASEYVLNYYNSVPEPEKYNTAPEAVKIISTLLNAGSKVDAQTTRGWTALMGAARGNTDSEVISTLIDAGADINKQNSLGRTALMIAARDTTNPEVIRTLIDAGADVNARSILGRTAIMMAARYNRHISVIDSITILLEAGANIDTRDYFGKTAWDYIQENRVVRYTGIYWELNEGRLE